MLNNSARITGLESELFYASKKKFVS